MPYLFEKNTIPKPGHRVENKEIHFTNTDIHLSFEQALNNAAKNSNSNDTTEFDGKNFFWTTETEVELPVKITYNGMASEVPTTIAECFAATVKQFGHETALFYKPKNGLDKPFLSYTWQEYWNACCKFAKSSLKLSMSEGDVVCMMGFNAPAWLIANFGSNLAGLISSGIYPSSTPDTIKYIANHCNAQIMVVDTVANVDKVLSVKQHLPSLKKIIMYYDEVTPYYSKLGVTSFSDFLEYGNEIPHDQVSARMLNLKPGKCVSLIYTSGTTGPPKAVMISNDNATWTAFITSKYTMTVPSDKMVSFLPLSHIAAQITDAYTPLYTGHKIYFANIDALQGSLIHTLKEVRPSWFLAVPRVYEKMESVIKAVGNSGSFYKKKVAAWMRSVGYEGTMNLLHGKPVSKIYKMVDSTLLHKIRKELGLDQCKGIAVTAAPILKSTQEFFMSLGIPISNIYGLSEITGPQSFCVNAENFHRIGSAGFTMSGAEAYIDNPDENGVGELCVRGRHVFMGYYKNEKATKSVINKYGFFHTGDTAYFDQDGFMFIVGRIKELIITSGGENIPPLLIENYVKKYLPFIANCQLIGDGKQFLSLLICLKATVNSDGSPSQQLDPAFVKEIHEKGASCTTTIEASKDKIIKNMIDKGIEQVNTHAASRAQYIRKWQILPHDFSEYGGELTSTLKLKRSFVVNKYASLIESIYNSTDSYLIASKI